MGDARDIAWLRNGIARLETRLEQLERALADRHGIEMARLGEILDQTMFCGEKLQARQLAGQMARAAVNADDIPIPDLPRWEN
jgi:hypothetical protein